MVAYGACTVTVPSTIMATSSNPTTFVKTPRGEFLPEVARNLIQRVISGASIYINIIDYQFAIHPPHIALESISAMTLLPFSHHF
uniref:Uncharacterized protein n=1 Tax=Arundo donax TaxID=35708 RepID=A0A0A9BPY2_ARUDO